MPPFATVVEIIEQVNTVAGLFLNILLFYAIRRFSRAHLGTYKHLLTIFSIVDIFLVFLHLLVHPRVLRVGNTHSVVTDTMYDDMRITTMYVGIQSVPFTLLGIHFFYRYCFVGRPHLIPLFSNKLFILFLVSVTVGELFAWHFLCLYTSDGHDVSVAKEALLTKYEEMYGKRIENAWIIMDNWPDGAMDVNLFTITSIMDVIMITSVTAASSFAILTYRHIKNAYKMSVQSIELQQKLFIALCAQAAIPALFVYTPFVICINAPFVGIPGTWLPDIAAPLMSFFPVWDAVIVMLLITDYRKGLIGMVYKPPPVGKSTMMQMTTIVVSSSTVETRDQ